MTGWDGKCSMCGVQIMGNPDTELHYDFDEYGCPAYCTECWNIREKQRITNGLKNPFFVLMVLCLIALIIWNVIR